MTKFDLFRRSDTLSIYILPYLDSNAFMIQMLLFIQNFTSLSASSSYFTLPTAMVKVYWKTHIIAKVVVYIYTAISNVYYSSDIKDDMSCSTQKDWCLMNKNIIIYFRPAVQVFDVDDVDEDQ